MSNRRKKRKKGRESNSDLEKWVGTCPSKKPKVNLLCILHSRKLTNFGKFVKFKDCKIPPTEKLEPCTRSVIDD